MAENPKPPEIPEPTEAEVLSIMHDDDLLEYRSSSGPSERRRSMFKFYEVQWKAQRAFEERSKEVEAARNAVNAELAEQSDKPTEKSDVDKAVESIEQRRASGQAELQREREKMREEDRRRADLRNRGASLWPGVDEQHARRMQAAFENKPERVPDSHRISRVLAGGLFALFFGALIQALTVFGVITMNSGHVFMVIAFVAGVLMITTEILPLKPTRHKVGAIVILGVVLGLIDLAAALYAHKRDASPAPQVDVVTPAPSPLPSPKTLHDYFSEQGGNCWRETVDREVTVKKKKLKVEAQMCMDFNKKAQHLAFYIPYEVREFTPEVCSRLIDTHEAIIREFTQRFQGTMEVGPIEGRQTQVKDLRFTKYLVFFHESYLTQDRLDLLDSKARRRGLIAEFHSQQYVMARTPK